ncbi:MAG: hypothetical protein K0Q66_532 [Chitinophagaceae bacterium]|jgi:predicted short-subunit dehydrogenase-like oxidoreductase (DUF2520 family)|nr:hypothetical protein [Chitinophagaceae bacterium]
MQVVIIGTGNAATVFGRLMREKGHHIVQVYGRDILKAEALAGLLHATAVGDLASITRNADVYLVAVADKAVAEITQQLDINDHLVLHTTASLSKHVLKEVSRRYGVLYPLQSLRREMSLQTPIPLLVDGNTAEVTLEIESFAASLSNSVTRADDQTRVKLHVAAVFACNFTNYMYLQSAKFCGQEGLDFSLLQPLIEETAGRLREFAPAEVFTGPAVRGDMETVNKHLSLLEAYPELHGLYKELTNKIIHTNARH